MQTMSTGSEKLRLTRDSKHSINPRGRLFWHVTAALVVGFWQHLLSTSGTEPILLINQSVSFNQRKWHRRLSRSTDFVTVRGVLKHQALQFRPLRVESLHQFVGIHWVGEVALRVRRGRAGQSIQFHGPAERQTDKELKTTVLPCGNSNSQRTKLYLSRETSSWMVSRASECTFWQQRAWTPLLLCTPSETGPAPSPYRPGLSFGLHGETDKQEDRPTLHQARREFLIRTKTLLLTLKGMFVLGMFAGDLGWA